MKKANLYFKCMVTMQSLVCIVWFLFVIGTSSLMTSCASTKQVINTVKMIDQKIEIIFNKWDMLKPLYISLRPVAKQLHIEGKISDTDWEVMIKVDGELQEIDKIIQSAKLMRQITGMQIKAIQDTMGLMQTSAKTIVDIIL